MAKIHDGDLVSPTARPERGGSHPAKRLQFAEPQWTSSIRQHSANSRALQPGRRTVRVMGTREISGRHLASDQPQHPAAH